MNESASIIEVEVAPSV